MGSEWFISGTLGFITGGVFIWFAKDWIQRVVIGGNTLAAKLRARADKIHDSLG